MAISGFHAEAALATVRVVKMPPWCATLNGGAPYWCAAWKMTSRSQTSESTWKTSPLTKRSSR